jgi:hypothetical protein
MIAAGAGIGEIADELALCFSLRPRPAWRYAHGWSLVQAAEQINATAYAAGMHASGVLAAMTGPHLSEHESWPGAGPVVTGRRPTPQVLALLARTYGAGIPDLLDALDHESLPPGDRLVIEVFSPACWECAGRGWNPGFRRSLASAGDAGERALLTCARVACLACPGPSEAKESRR